MEALRYSEIYRHEERQGKEGEEEVNLLTPWR
jgi:hypothetical protein